MHTTKLARVILCFVVALSIVSCDGSSSAGGSLFDATTTAATAAPSLVATSPSLLPTPLPTLLPTPRPAQAVVFEALLTQYVSGQGKLTFGNTAPAVGCYAGEIALAAPDGKVSYVRFGEIHLLAIVATDPVLQQATVQVAVPLDMPTPNQAGVSTSTVNHSFVNY